MKLNPDGSIVPNLAASVRQPSPVVYIYTLRKGVRFWNGKELTAEDVANAMNYHRYPGSATLSGYPASVKSIKATGRYTVQVTLKYRDASWPFVVTSQFGTGVFEKAFADAHRGTLGTPGVLTMGTGPWRFDKLDPTSGLELSANRRWWGGKVPFDRISIKFFSNETSMALALRAGEIDVAPQINNVQAFQTTSNARVGTGPSCALLFFSMNTQAPPWNDIHVRRAVAHVINRANFVKASGNSANVPATTFIPRTHLSVLGTKAEIDKVIKSLPKHPYNLSAAKREMAQSAYPDGFTASVPVLNFGVVPLLNQALAGQLQEIGIKLQPTAMTTAAVVAAISGPIEKRPGYLNDSGCSAPDPSYYPGFFLGSRGLRQGGFNFAAYAPPAVDALMKAGVRELNKKKRLETYAKLLTRVGTDVPYVPIYNSARMYAISSKLKWPTFNGIWTRRPWALEIQPAT